MPPVWKGHLLKMPCFVWTNSPNHIYHIYFDIKLRKPENLHLRTCNKQIFAKLYQLNDLECHKICRLITCWLTIQLSDRLLTMRWSTPRTKMANLCLQWLIWVRFLCFLVTLSKSVCTSAFFSCKIYIYYIFGVFVTMHTVLRSVLALCQAH